MPTPLVSFQSDKVLLSGPKVDGSYRVTFEVGEYELGNIRDLVTVRDTTLFITVNNEE